jgi:hypothetical protein
MYRCCVQGCGSIGGLQGVVWGLLGPPILPNWPIERECESKFEGGLSRSDAHECAGY